MATKRALRVSRRLDGKWGVSMLIDPNVMPSVCDQIMSQFKASMLTCRSVADLEAAIRAIDAGLDGIDFEIDQRATHADPLAHYVTITARPSPRAE